MLAEELELLDELLELLEIEADDELLLDNELIEIEDAVVPLLPSLPVLPANMQEIRIKLIDNRTIKKNTPFFINRFS